MSKIIDRIRKREALAVHRLQLENLEAFQWRLHEDIMKLWTAKPAAPPPKTVSGGRLFEHIALGVAIAMTAYLLTH